MFLVRRKETDEENQGKLLVAYTIILFISSLFVPFVVVATFQSMVYFSRSYWFFSTPLSAYMTFMCGMIYIALVLTFYLLVGQKWEGKRAKGIMWILLVLCIPFFILSLTNYYYLDDEGVHYNSLTSLKEKQYKWGEMAKVHIVYRNYQGSTGFYQYKFEMPDGSTITIPYNDKLSEHKYQVEAKIKEFNIPISDNFRNPVLD